jgi:hypothetical protein
LAHAQLRHDKEFLSKKTDGSGIIQDFLWEMQEFQLQK